MNAVNGSQSTEHTRYPFGDGFDDLNTDETFDRFLAAYVRLCSFLLLVDALLLSQQPAEQLYHLPLLSLKHMRSLHNILRFEKTPVFQVLHKEYGVDVQELNTRMQKDFLRASGAQNLLRLVDMAFHRLALNIQNSYATYASQLLATLGWTIFELPGEDTFIDRSQFHRGVLSFFQNYSAELYDPSLPIDSGVARDLILYYGTLVQELCQWDDSIAPKLMNQLLDLADLDSPISQPAANSTRSGNVDYRQDPSCYPSLVSYAYKFKVLRKYIIKGNMGLRVMSIATMDTALVEVWREFSKIDPSCRHPVIQYLADFLMQGQVVDYIVSVDSHPQLISRSGNIAGFLVIAHRWSDDQADAIWKNVSSSPDSRVVAATMTMLRNIINLMTLSDRLYLCTKLYDLPLDRYNLDILRFLRILTVSFNEHGNSIHSIEDEDRGSTARPWSVCIRLIRETAPSRYADKNMLDLQHEAFEQFRYLAAAIPSNQRHMIYRECAQQIVARSDTATGNYRIFWFLAQCAHPDDNMFFEENEDLTYSALGEIPSFVQKQVQSGSYPWQIQALQYRLDLVRLTITHPSMSIPVNLHKTLWDHIVGDKALSNQARDLAWLTLLQANKSSLNSEFCQRLVSSYIPKMDARLYTPGLFDFVASYDFPVTQKTVRNEQGTDTLLQIPGADLLWPLILCAPTGTIEESAARLLATRYVRVVEIPGVSLAEVEKAHIELVEQCMQRLRVVIEALQGQATDGSNSQKEPEVHVRRILLFQKLLLECVRQKPELNRGRRIDSKVDAMDTDLTNGDAITIRYQYGNNRHCITMSSEHTVDDLYRKLCHATGFTKVNLFARGQRLKVFEEAAVKLSEIEFGGQVIVQRADGAELTRPLPDLAAGSSVFETAVVKHFDELFAWMDSGNNTSYLVSLIASSVPILLIIVALRIPHSLPHPNYFCGQSGSGRRVI
jgi:ubiquitin carboxyl-terminal hydrolase 34